MKILVIGGTRYFGKRLVHMLIKEGHEIWVMSRGKTEDDFGARVHRLKADRSKKEEMLSVLGSLKFDAVVDQVCMDAQQAALAVEVFTERTSYYIMTSTMSVYDWGPRIKEEDCNPFLYQPRQAGNPAEQYGENKRAAEATFANQNAFAWAFARFPVVLGEDDYTERLLGQIRRVQEGTPIYYPNLHARFSFISSEDAARALLWLLHGKHEGAYNFASPDSWQLAELVENIEKVTGKKAQLQQKPSDEAWSPLVYGCE